MNTSMLEIRKYGRSDDDTSKVSYKPTVLTVGS